MSRRIFVIDDDEVAMEVARMLKSKEKQRRRRSMYDDGRNLVNYPSHQTEEHYGGCGSVGCGATMSYCGMRDTSSYGCGGGRRRQPTYGCGAYPTFGTCG